MKEALQRDISEEFLIDEISNPSGSVWHRWDPHIHAPGTILNNQFSGENPWEEFLQMIETSSPRIRALGITDYYSLALYEEVLNHKLAGRLPDVNFIFPNIELRFQIETAKKSAVNFHLLFSPEDPNHVDEIKGFLNHLTYSAYDGLYHCNDRDLIKLGYKHKSECENDRQALEEGANQFKVDLTQLKDRIKNSGWFQENALIAVAGGGRDGTSGLQGDSSFESTRVELERLAHIVFSSNPRTIDFWLGKGAASRDDLKRKWNGRKPCLHGSDAHSNDDVGIPDNDRRSWIKGDLNFEALKQTVIEPEGRVFIGKLPPIEIMPSYTMSAIDVKNADWLKTPFIPLNTGLITIIGARGSGKTALADLIALGAGSDVLAENDSSFIKRAKNLLTDEKVVLHWEGGQSSENEASMVDALGMFDDAKVQYLSQQFVERLCSSEGLTDELMQEIERVIFETHAPAARKGTTSFDDLLDVRSANILQTRESYEQQIKDVTIELNALREKKDNLPELGKQLESKKKIVENDKINRKTLLGKTDDDETLKAHGEVTAALDDLRLRLDAATKKHNTLLALQENAEIFETTKLPETLRKLKAQYKDAGLSDAQWESFTLEFKGDVGSVLDEEIQKAEAESKRLTGADVACPDGKDEKAMKRSLIPANTQMKDSSYNLLKAEQDRLQKLIGINQENATRIRKLSEKISKEENICAGLHSQIEDAENSDDRIKELRKLRRDAYKGVFQTILRHEEILTELYKPLMDNLEQEQGSLGKLTFQVQRNVNVEQWAAQGENLFDLRKAGAFCGRGALEEVIKRDLLTVWQGGTADEIADAMVKFLKDYETDFKQHCPYDKSNKESYRQWIHEISAWLYSTDHISINYGIQYDGVNIQRLSPGTRGIVLLLLYLAIDKEDYRPLIIDQPEENLDPKSIFDELVPRFRAAKLRRQIIIVTHNANLVVNTDADQVIVASCEPHQKGKLPNITYESGGLENKMIRQKVCEILEGGEEAFQERAKRLRVRI